MQVTGVCFFIYVFLNEINYIQLAHFNRKMLLNAAIFSHTLCFRINNTNMILKIYKYHHLLLHHHVREGLGVFPVP
jgi:uncharacterized membrane protein